MVGVVVQPIHVPFEHLNSQPMKGIYDPIQHLISRNIVKFLKHESWEIGR